MGHGAKSVARGHYIAPDQLGHRLELLRRLPLPDRVQLQAKVVEAADAGEYAARVIRLPVGRAQ